MKMPSSLPKPAVYLACIMLVTHPRITAQAPGIPEQDLDIHPIGPDMVLEWQSVVGRTYFLQVSGGLAPAGIGPALLTWAWADVIEEGHGGVISYEFGGDAPHGFARLHYTDEPRPPGVSLDEWDTDGDGRSNADEINGNPQSNPLLYSTSGTGISDGWAVAHGLNPNDPSIGGLPFQQSGLTNLQASQAGVQAHPNASLTNFDGDELENDQDADPDDRVIDWRPGAHPSFAVIELDVDDVEELLLDDFTEKGTILLSRIQNYAAVGRVVIDSEQAPHDFDHLDPTVEGAFGGHGPVLVGERVLGIRLVNGSNQESLWDPTDNTFTPWQRPTAYPGDLRDERDGLLIGRNWLNFPAGPGLRRSPNGTLLPGDEILDSNHARIEANGNVLSNKAYWRRGPLIGPPSPFEHELQAPVVLPESWWTGSATLEQSESVGMQKWNIVAGWGGVMVSKNNGAFVKANGSLSGAFTYGATRQGWVADQAFSQIWANGEWHDLKDCHGDPLVIEAALMGILDTGLAVSRIRRDNGPFKLALLIPVELAAKPGKVHLGFDPPNRSENDPRDVYWTSVVQGKNNSILLLHIAKPETMKWVIDPGDEDRVDISPKTFTNETTELQLSGKGDDPAAIETTIRLVPLGQAGPAVLTLKVLVLPQRDKQLAIYRLEDPNALPTQFAQQPVTELPTDAEILEACNDSFAQAGEQFTLHPSSGSYQFPYDTRGLNLEDGYSSALDVRASDGELTSEEEQALMYSYHPLDGEVRESAADGIFPVTGGDIDIYRIILIKKSGIPYGPEYPGQMVRGLVGTILFTHHLQQKEQISMAAAHEIGHVLKLSVAGPNGNGDDAGGHDEPPYSAPVAQDRPNGSPAVHPGNSPFTYKPAPNRALMQAGTPEADGLPWLYGRWMRWEDWEEANNRAGGIGP